MNVLIQKFGSSVVGSCAEHGWGRKARLLQIARIAKTFSPDERLPDISWAWFRAASDAASRVKDETPFEILMKALDKDWAYKDLCSYGKPKEVEFVLVEVCPVCTAQVVIRTTEFVPGTVKCPVCTLKGVDTELNDLVRKE